MLQDLQLGTFGGMYCLMFPALRSVVNQPDDVLDARGDAEESSFWPKRE